MQSEVNLSSPSGERLAAWRLFLESSQALVDVLDADLQEHSGISLRWYDVLVHLEEAPDGRLRMRQLAGEVAPTPGGTDLLESARSRHPQAIEHHVAQHLTAAEAKTLTRALTKLRDHARPLRQT